MSCSIANVLNVYFYCCIGTIIYDVQCTVFLLRGVLWY